MKRIGKVILSVLVLTAASWAHGGVTSTFDVDSEFWDDGGGNASFGHSSQLGPDSQPGVLRILTHNNPSFPNIDGPADFQGDLSRYAGSVVGGKNLLMGFDTKWVNFDYPGAEYRIYTGTGPSTTIWKKSVGNPSLGADQWDHIEETVNTAWTDAEAQANGWVLHQGGHTFAQTFADVAVYRIDFPQITPSITEILFDNITLDEISLAELLGDMDDDGDVDNFDIGPFELALSNPSQYELTYPGVDREARGDINQDNVFDNFDIGPFETLLTGASLMAGLDGSPSVLTEGLLMMKAQALGVSVPEPASVGLVALSGLMLLRRRPGLS